MRLDKLISNQTNYSRSEVKKLIKNKQVQVNGEIYQDCAKKIEQTDEVRLNQTLIKAPSRRYFMLNKPEGYLSSNKDSNHSLVFDLLSEWRIENLMLAGRLDIDTTGLLLISDDGSWCHRITSPNHQCSKRYLVTTAEPLEEKLIGLFSKGLMLKDSKKRTRSCLLEILDNNLAYVTLTEGRYHQVKRMFAATGNRVIRLHRDRVGSLELDNQLASGQYRALKPYEIELF